MSEQDEHDLQTFNRALEKTLASECDRLRARVAELEGLLKAALERIPIEHDFDHTPSDDAVRADILAALERTQG